MLLLIVFRSVVAAVEPLMIGILSIGGTFPALLVMSKFVDTRSSPLNIATALSLGLAVDYGLLLVSRLPRGGSAIHGYTERRTAHLVDPPDAR